MKISIEWGEPGKLAVEAEDRELGNAAAEIVRMCEERCDEHVLTRLQFTVDRTPLMNQLFEQHLVNHRFGRIEWYGEAGESVGHLLVYRRHGWMLDGK